MNQKKVIERLKNISAATSKQRAKTSIPKKLRCKLKEDDEKSMPANFRVYEDIYSNEREETNQYIEKITRKYHIIKSKKKRVNVTEMNLETLGREYTHENVPEEEDIDAPIDINFNSPKLKKMHKHYVHMSNKLPAKSKRIVGDTIIQTENLSKILSTSFYEYKKGDLFHYFLKSPSHQRVQSEYATSQMYSPEKNLLTPVSKKHVHFQPISSRKIRTSPVRKKESGVLNSLGDSAPETASGKRGYISLSSSIDCSKKQMSPLINIREKGNTPDSEKVAPFQIAPQNIHGEVVVAKPNEKKLFHQTDPKCLKRPSPVKVPTKGDDVEALLSINPCEAPLTPMKASSKPKPVFKRLFRVAEIHKEKIVHKFERIFVNIYFWDDHGNRKKIQSLEFKDMPKNRLVSHTKNLAKRLALNESESNLQRISSKRRLSKKLEKDLVERLAKRVTVSCDDANMLKFGKKEEGRNARFSISPIRSLFFNPGEPKKKRKNVLERQKTNKEDKKSKKAFFSQMKKQFEILKEENAEMPNYEKRGNFYKRRWREMKAIDTIVKKCERLVVDKSANDELSFFYYIKDLENQRFSDTLEILKEIDFADASASKLMYDYKKKGAQADRIEMKEVSQEYKSGLTDLSRQVAKLEKQKFSKKKHTKRDRASIVKSLRSQLYQ